MRKKILDEEKKKSINLTINPQLNELLDKYIKEKGINKSKFIEQLLEDKLKNNK
jgi:metal-responsive CopG/Arc/MetJ family transcriptional regulator